MSPTFAHPIRPLGALPAPISVASRSTPNWSPHSLRMRACPADLRVISSLPLHLRLALLPFSETAPSVNTRFPYSHTRVELYLLLLSQNLCVAVESG